MHARFTSDIRRYEVPQTKSSSLHPRPTNSAGAEWGPRGPRERRREGVRRDEVPGKYWSGRRGSNPRPTAWKAVTLPLSYSRLRAAPLRHCGASAGQARFHVVSPAAPPRRFGGASPSLTRWPLVHRSAKLDARTIRFDGPSLACPAEPASTTSAQRRLGLPSRSSRSVRRLVARGGFEPPKPLGRQIYSLLRLTASLPRQSPTPNDAPPFGSSVQLSVQGAQPNSPSAWNVLGSCDVREWGAARILELAKGFEPPTG